jgi:hypothetical protein
LAEIQGRHRAGSDEVNLEMPMPSQPGQWIRDELCARLRAAGLRVGTESDPNDLTVIDDADIPLRISECQRWGGIGYEVDLGHFLTFKTDRQGKLDFDAMMPAILRRIKEEKASQAKQLRLHRLRERLFELIEPLGVKMRSPFHGRLGKTVLTVENERVILTVPLSLRRPGEVRELIEFLLRNKNVHE